MWLWFSHVARVWGGSMQHTKGQGDATLRSSPPSITEYTFPKYYLMWLKRASLPNQLFPEILLYVMRNLMVHSKPANDFTIVYLGSVHVHQSTAITRNICTTCHCPACSHADKAMLTAVCATHQGCWGGGGMAGGNQAPKLWSLDILELWCNHRAALINIVTADSTRSPSSTPPLVTQAPADCQCVVNICCRDPSNAALRCTHVSVVVFARMDFVAACHQHNNKPHL